MAPLQHALHVLNENRNGVKRTECTEKRIQSYLKRVICSGKSVHIGDILTRRAEKAMRDTRQDEFDARARDPRHNSVYLTP